MIKSKFILVVLILFQSTFFVGCNRPEMPIEKKEEPKINKSVTFSIPKKIPKKVSEKNPEKIEVKVDEDTENPTNIILTGTITLPDNYSNQKKISVSVLPVNNQPGTIINKSIQLENSGYYSLSNLAQGIYDIVFKLENFKTFKTNLFIYPPKTELNFSFSGLLNLELRGKVINGFDKKPIEGITVCAHSWRNKPAYDTDITDKDGMFSLDLISASHSDRFFGEIIIDEPGFGKIIKQIQSAGEFTMITIALWPAGQISGTITTEDGTPLSGFTVNADNMMFSKFFNYQSKL